jgi:hypothetical protein
MSIIGDIIEETVVEPLERKVKELETRLEVARAFHDVAVSERDYERHRYDSIKLMQVDTEFARHDAERKVEELLGKVEMLEHEVEVLKGYSGSLEEKVTLLEEKLSGQSSSAFGA